MRPPSLLNKNNMCRGFTETTTQKLFLGCQDPPLRNGTDLDLVQAFPFGPIRAVVKLVRVDLDQGQILNPHTKSNKIISKNRLIRPGAARGRTSGSYVLRFF